MLERVRERCGKLHVPQPWMDRTVFIPQQTEGKYRMGS